MNAVLQCLSHTDILAEYFVLDQYKVIVVVIAIIPMFKAYYDLCVCMFVSN